MSNFSPRVSSFFCEVPCQLIQATFVYILNINTTIHPKRFQELFRPLYVVHNYMMMITPAAVLIFGAIEIFQLCSMLPKFRPRFPNPCPYTRDSIFSACRGVLFVISKRYKQISLRKICSHFHSTPLPAIPKVDFCAGLICDPMLFEPYPFTISRERGRVTDTANKATGPLFFISLRHLSPHFLLPRKLQERFLCRF